MDIKVPDLGNFTDVAVIEIFVEPGQVVAAEDPLVTLETDKATMDIPAPFAGTITSLTVKLGDKLNKGDLIAIGEPEEATESPAASEGAPASAVVSDEARRSLGEDAPTSERSEQGARGGATATRATSETAVDAGDTDGLRATPLVRRLARDLEINLDGVSGSGGRGRVTKQDVLTAYDTSRGASGGGSGIPPIPAVDFSQFGPIHEVPLSRIKKISGPYLHRSWLNIPHVTHNDEADITDLDAYRRELDEAAKAEGYRVTLLSFLLKAAAASLRKFPEVNSSLSGDNLILKDYVHIGVAVDTEGGLVVPVIRDVDRKGITELSHELADLSSRAREGKLSGAEMQGASFTISSLGGIGGTSFTPIVNAPEVAILGVVRSKMAPVWDGEAFVPRLMLPLSLSYDHRVIDGALAARFVAHFGRIVEDVRRLVL
ncbi:acetyltransferase component of pyruvate dehydrogenase complex [Nocardioides baekrokdamisoli]|uniref:Dihydrolipoamide acetyltransferase component of pyruvate dehydrogenase complex n=1 Tax=Nocardioides baekrokdamisoli TaxID=1804624 RepID=A0A3G9IZU5_9ACTN|nr:2-oxo acid dehydrogenase subunit E2 [Nocardioides baekrokdamisoli]BBH17873.1 acetyltransferase component of pyruvate dehydrogenase complex [Nocardioides baekrokdamisoli]